MSIEGLISDTHNHNWSVFSSTLPTGVNSRLQHILDETWRAAVTVKERGGDTIIHTGDIFHVRGSVAPSVLNPTVELYGRIYNDLGLNIYLLAGNHDLEGNNSSTLGNAGCGLSRTCSPTRRTSASSSPTSTSATRCVSTSQPSSAARIAKR